MNKYMFYIFLQYLILPANKQSLPEISPQMIKKLRHLTIASLAAQCKHIPYSLLLTELDLHNVRELEVSVSCILLLVSRH